MKFKIVRSKFFEALKSVQNVVTSKGSLPILQNVLIEAQDGILTMITTDLEIAIKTTTTCEVIDEGKTTLPIKVLFNAINRVEECEVEVTIDEEQHAKIKAGSAAYRLIGKPATEFPQLEVGEIKSTYKMPFATLHEMLRKTAYAAAQDDTRRTLRGVLMRFGDGKLTMVATDGRRLAMIENEVEFAVTDEGDIVLPSKLVQELLRISDADPEVSISVSDTKVCFNLGGAEIISKVIDDVYPNFMQVIPENRKEKINVDRQLLMNALERASVMTMDEAHSTKLAFSTNVLRVSAAASEVGDANDEVPIKYAGETIEILFNPIYVLEALKVIDDDEITIDLNDGNSPAVIHCAMPFIYVLMPLRIS